VRLAQAFAIENEFIRADAIEASEFPDLSARYRVYAVPRTVINGEGFVEGSLPEDFFLDAVLKAINPETHDGEAL
jgi:hypothetical protein